MILLNRCAGTGSNIEMTMTMTPMLWEKDFEGLDAEKLKQTEERVFFCVNRRRPGSVWASEAGVFAQAKESEGFDSVKVERWRCQSAH